MNNQRLECDLVVSHDRLPSDDGNSRREQRLAVALAESLDAVGDIAERQEGGVRRFELGVGA